MLERSAPKPEQEGKTFGSLSKKKNEGPFDPIAKKDIAAWTGEQGVKPAAVQGVEAPLQPRIEDIVSGISRLRENFKEKARREARQQEFETDHRALIEANAALRGDILDARQKGDTGLSKKLEETLNDLEKLHERHKSLRTMRENAQKHTDAELEEVLAVMEGQTTPDKRTVAEIETMGDEERNILMQALKDELRERRESRVASQPAPEVKSIEEQMAQHGVVEIENKKPTPEETTKQKNDIAQKELIAQVDSDLKTIGGKEKVNTTEVESLLKKLAATAVPQEALKQIDEDISARVREIRETKQLSKIVAEVGKDRAAERGEIINTSPAIAPERRKGILETVSRAGKSYRVLPMWKKLAISAALLGIGGAGVLVGGPAGILASTLAFTGGRILSGIGAFAMTEAIMERKKINRKAVLASSLGVGALWAAFVPSVAHYADQYFHINDTLRHLFGFTKSGGAPGLSGMREGMGATTGLAGGDPLFNPAPTPGAPAFAPGPAVGAPGLDHAPGAGVAETLAAGRLFDAPITVTQADRLHGLWGIIERKLTDANLIDASTSVQKKNYMLDFLEKKLQTLDPAELKRLGFASGKIGIIHAGEKLDLSILDKAGWIKQVRLFR